MQLTSEEIAVLRKTPILNGVDPSDLDALIKALRFRRLDKGKVLFRQGRSGDSMAFVASGWFHVLMEEGRKRPLEVARIRKGDVVGEMSCLDPAPRSATVVSAEPSSVLELDRVILRSLQDHAPGLAISIVSGVIKRVTQRIRQTNQLIEKKLSSIQPGASSPIPDGDAPDPLAAFAGIKPQPHKEPIDLDHVRALSQLTAQDRLTLNSVARPLRYPLGALLCREGARGASCFIIVSGAVEVVRFIAGEQKVLATLRDGALVGQMSLVDAQPRSATLRAADDVVGLEFDRDSFEQLLAARSGFAIRFQELIAAAGIRQLREADSRLVSLASQPLSPAAVPPADPDGDFEQTRGYDAEQDGMQSERITQRRARPSDRYDIEMGDPEPDRRPTVRMQAIHADEEPDTTSDELTAPASRSPGPNVAQEKGQLAASLSYMQASLKMWGMSMDDLDQVRAVTPDGIMSATESRSRSGRPR